MVREVERLRAPFATRQWEATSLTVEPLSGGERRTIVNPADPTDQVGVVTEASRDDCLRAIEAAQPWTESGVTQRAFILRRAAELFESNAGELLALLAREAGKTLPDAVAELREAVDFLRYYANSAEALGETLEARGTFTCISPWNFPLAIFTGQIAAALAAGNAVLAKPAETTPLISTAAVRLLHAAGVPRDTLQLVLGDGGTAGAALTSDTAVNGVCFTGSTATAMRIHRSMADHLDPGAPLIAETGGINVGIVDSTALPEQAVRDAVASAFQSAGQRCSALRVLYLQDDVADLLLDMLFGAMDELQLGESWALATDVGPVITAEARDAIQAYVDQAKREGRLLKQLPAPQNGHFVGPAVIEVDGIEAVEKEVFGPVLHVTRFRAEDFDEIITRVNERGYGLTFGLHTRIDERVKNISSAVHAGNLYVNRNQIGAVVESQPFGGEGLSGTGPKAGGPHYVQRFFRPLSPAPGDDALAEGAGTVDPATVQKAIDALAWYEPTPLESRTMPGPTGEENTLALWPRGLVLCLGPTAQEAALQAGTARRMGCAALMVAPGVDPDLGIDGVLEPEALEDLRAIAVVALWGDRARQRAARQALARRTGPLTPLVTEDDLESYCLHERHTCIDTTAAGGNASLLAASGD